MDAIGFLMIGVGGYLMYAAYKKEHPWTVFQSVIGVDSVAGNSTSTSGTSAGGSGPTTKSLFDPGSVFG